jgi:branched-chain amino acid transport system substrate-binding protein
MKNRKALALIAILALVAAACGGSDTADEVAEVEVETTEAPATTEAPTTTEAASGDPLVLGTLMPLTGDLGFLGPGIESGAILAVTQINAAGGVNGQPVVWVQGDSGTAPDVASASLATLIGEGVAGVMGAAASGISLAIMQTAIDAGVVMVSPSNTSPQFTKVKNGGFYARTAPSDLLQGAVLAQVLIEDGVKTLSIISRADSYGRGLAEATAAAFEDADEGRVVNTIVYHDQNATEFSSEVTQVGKNNSDAIVGILFPSTGCGVLQAAFEQGSIETPWYFTDGVRGANLSSECGLGNALDGYKGTAPGSTAGDALDAFTAAYKAEFGEDPAPYSAQAYDAIMIMALSAAANGVTGADIASGLVAVSGPNGDDIDCIGVDCVALAAEGVEIDYKGASGDINLDEQGDPTASTYDVWQITSGDEEEVLKSIDFGS